MILLVLSVLLVPMQLHFFFDMPILNQSLQRLPEVVIIVFLAVYSSDTIHLTIMQLDDRLAPLLDYDNCKPNNMTNINMPLRCARHSTEGTSAVHVQVPARVDDQGLLRIGPDVPRAAAHLRPARTQHTNS